MGSNWEAALCRFPIANASQYLPGGGHLKAKARLDLSLNWETTAVAKR